MRTGRLAVLLVSGSVSSAGLAAPCANFVDVDDANATYCAAVSYVKDRGVTLGCTDAIHYCPNDYVTRLQMALFLQRMGRADPTNTLGDSTTAIGGGRNNNAVSLGGYSTVAGGVDNTASGTISTVAGGYANIASGTVSIVAGGYGNVAAGSYSFAAGHFAAARENGMFVWADANGQNDYDPTTFRAAGQSANTFNVRATGAGGVLFTTGIDSLTGAPTWGCYTYSGGGWTCASDRNIKRNLEPIDGQLVLSQLAAMPIYHWQPKDGPKSEVRHLGPMAQDFYATFGLGDSDKAIGMQDAEGIALAAIQGLNVKLETKVAEQAHEISELRSAHEHELAELRRAVEVLLARTSPEGRTALAR